MRKLNAENERIKHRYFNFLSEAKRLHRGHRGSSSRGPNRFETSTNFKEFRLFRIEQAQSYKRRIAHLVSPNTGEH